MVTATPLATTLAAVGIPLVKDSLPRVIDAFVTKSKVDKEVLSAFIQFFRPTVAELTDALESLSEGQATVSNRVLDVIKEAVSHCTTHLASCSSLDERAQVSLHVLQLVKEARAIADAERGFRLRLMAGSTGIALVAGAAVVGLRHPMAGATLLRKGLRLLGRVRLP